MLDLSNLFSKSLQSGENPKGINLIGIIPLFIPKKNTSIKSLTYFKKPHIPENMLNFLPIHAKDFL